MFEVFLYAFYLLLPFSFALNPVADVDLPIVRVAVAILFLAWLLGALLRRQLKIESPFILSLFIFWLLWSTSSIFWAFDMTWSIRKVLFILNIGVFFPLLLTFTANNLKKPITGFILGSISIALVACAQSLLPLFLSMENVLTLWNSKIAPFFLGESSSLVVKDYPSLLVNILGVTYLRATAFFPDPHTLSLYLGLALPLVAVWQYKQKTFLAKVGLFVILLAILLTFSRGAYIALFLTSVILLTVLFLENRQQYGKYFLGGIVLLGLVFFATPIGPRVLSSWSQEDGSRTERLRLLNEAVGHVLERPLLGIGIGNYPILVKPDAATREPIYVHNLYLDILVEQGFVGLLLFLSFVLGSLGKGFFTWRREGDPLVLACCVGTIYFLWHGMFEAPLFSFHVMLALFLLLAYQVVPKEKTL